jgi:hypothetical protein
MTILNYLTSTYNKVPDDIISTYFENNPKKQIMTYFRLYFFFYVVIKYILKEDINKKVAHDTIIEYFDKVINNKNKKIIINNISHHHDFLFRVFFIENNIYFHTYFNNLIKYVLPLPSKYFLYCPFMTYRNVEDYNLYTKTDLDYLDQPTYLDKVKVKTFVRKKNVDIPEQDMNIHLPINKYDDKIFNFEKILIVSTKEMSYICEDNYKVLYKRSNKINQNMYEKGVPFELLFEEWTEGTNDKINQEDIIYMCVCKKISIDDINNVFESIDFKKGDYKILYHNTKLLNKTKEEYNAMLDKPTFFLLTPKLKPDGYYSYDRWCLKYNIESDINNLLDLTSSVVSSNSFMKYLTDRDVNKWESYDNTTSEEYFENKQMKTRIHKNNKCLTSKNIDIINFIRERPYCDIGPTSYYTGRRKLQELVYKTRKYDHSKIYTYSSLEHIVKYYKGLGIDLSKRKIYYPEVRYEYANYDMDIVFLDLLGVKGFFFTDYEILFDVGGEIMLIKPNNNITLKEIKEHVCNK